MKHRIGLTLLLLLPLTAVASEKAKVITSHERPVQCIAPIEVNKIDGEEVLVNTKVIEIEPGKHTISGRAPHVNTTYCRAPAGPTFVDVPPLEHEFEAGKTYWVGLDHSAHNRREWRYVVWKEED